MSVGRSLFAAEFRDPFVLDTFAEWAAAQEARDAQRWVAAFLRLTGCPDRELGDVAPEIVAYQRAAATETVSEHARPDAVEPTFVADAADRAAEIAVPVLAIVGAIDSADHLTAATELVTATGGRLVTIDAAAHYPNLEHPAEFTAALREFVDA